MPYLRGMVALRYLSNPGRELQFHWYHPLITFIKFTEKLPNNLFLGLTCQLKQDKGTYLL